VAKMNIKSVITLALIQSLSFVASGNCANTEPARKESIIVYGDNFSFSVSEPHAWSGDIENAKNFAANIIFYKPPFSKNGYDGPLIQIGVFAKHDENTINDLKYDINGYRRDFPKMIENKFSAKYKSYKSFSASLNIDGKITQYITYLNPGKAFKNGISVSMNITKSPATKDEIDAYLHIIESLWMIN
jgi:hypothetical protein